MKAKRKAKLSVEALGMNLLLEENKLLDVLPKEDYNFEVENDAENDEDDDCDESNSPDESTVTANNVTHDPEEITQNVLEIEEDVKNLHENELISLQAVANVQKMFKRIPGFESSISLFIAKDKPEKVTTNNKSIYSPYVEVKIDDMKLKEPVYIRKGTAVWLFQEGERVSSDRLLRVRANQLFNSVPAKSVNYQDKSKGKNPAYDEGLPAVNSKIEIGELCVFRTSASSCEWRIGKVQKFSKFKCKRLKDQEYKGTFAETKLKDVGVLNLWFLRSESSLIEYDMETCSQTHIDKSLINHHVYIPIFDYVCTLNKECFDIFHVNHDKSSFQVHSTEINIKSVANCKNKEIMDVTYIKLTEKCLSAILNLIKPNDSEMKMPISCSSKSEVILYC